MDLNNTSVEVFEKVNIAIKDEQPFVIYRHPESELVKVIIQKDDQLHYSIDFQESGFVFAPFDNTAPSILFPFADSTLFSCQFEENIFNNKKDNVALELNSEESKSEHISLVEKGIKFLEINDFKKVVLSRKETITSVDFKVVETFKKLHTNYKNAFVFCWFHPKVGLWLGATPETLLKVNENSFSTMALAGTQVYDSDTKVKWRTKEVIEQQYVTDFILEQLNVNVKISKPYTTKAGNLLHLRTDILGELTENLTLKKIINLLHPTPAVCGVPKQEAKDFILKNENYNREFYTGFLGELNLNNTSNIFVNLRCMQVLEKQIEIYIGGGITKDSNPPNEWEETVAKTKVMMKVL